MTDERHAQLLAALAGIVFLAAAALHWSAPLVEWDHVYVSAAESWARGVNTPWIYDHPPLYTAGLAVVFLLGGPSVVLGRLANAACLLAAAALIVRVTGRIASPKAGWWAAACFLLSPLVIQGSASFDGADTTLMPAVFMVWLAVVEASWRRPRKSSWEAIGFATGLCCWAKATATIALMAGAVAFLAGSPRGQDRHWRRHLLKGLLFGVAVFVFTWSLVSLVLWGTEAWKVALMTPARAFASNVSLGPAAKASRIVLDSARLLCWVSPFLLVMVAAGARELWRGREAKRHPVSSLLAWITVAYVAVFLALRGTQWSFPRYHVAIMPFACMLAGIFCHDAWARLSPCDQRRGLWLAAGLAVLTPALFGDPLLFFSLTWKQAALAGTLEADAPRGLLQAAAFLALPWVVSRLMLRQARAALVVALLATFGAFNVIHARAPYLTAYQYGSQGKPQVLELVAARLRPGDAVLATPEFLYEFRSAKVPWVPIATWHQIGTVASALRELRPRAIILGLTTQTLETWRSFARHPEIQAALQAGYRRHDIGTYQVWLNDG